MTDTDRPTKYELTFHEKQMRFFTRLFVVIFAVSTAAIVWLVNTRMGRH